MASDRAPASPTGPADPIGAPWEPSRRPFGGPAGTELRGSGFGLTVDIRVVALATAQVWRTQEIGSLPAGASSVHKVSFLFYSSRGCAVALATARGASSSSSTRPTSQRASFPSFSSSALRPNR